MRTSTLWTPLFALLGAELFAHGLMQSPPSRSWICGNDTKMHEVPSGTAKTPACSTAFNFGKESSYNFMAVLTHGLGRSKVTPLPKNVCGFDAEPWNGGKTPWDVAMAWPTTPVTAGPMDITWNISWGNHFDDTDEFAYWITKSNFVFSKDKELTWEDFEAEPFCLLKYDDKTPTANPDIVPDLSKSLFKTRCTLPARSGHHVIYGEWGRRPITYERFHGCIDVAYGGTPIDRPEKSLKRIQPAPQSGKRIDMLGRSRKPGTQGRSVEVLPALP
jgi:chitin-binding protein